MKINKDILQKFIDNSGEYLLVNRYKEGFGASQGKDEWEAIVMSPNVDRKLWGKKVGEMPFDDVEQFANQDIRSCIHLGNTYSPFQYGIYHKDMIDVFVLKDIKIMDFIFRCYSDNITDFWKAKELAESLKLLASEN